MTVRKTQEVPQYDPASYRTCRTHVTASVAIDGSALARLLYYTRVHANDIFISIF